MGLSASSEKDKEICKLRDKVTNLEAKLTNVRDIYDALREQKLTEDEAFRWKLRYESVFQLSIFTFYLPIKLSD